MPCPASRPAVLLSTLLLAASLATAALPAPGAGAATVRQARTAMGSPFRVTAVHPDAEAATAAVEAAYAEIERIEALISSWRETSETSAVNRAAGGEPVAVSPELFNLLRRSLKVSELTGGAFDVTFAGVGRLWNIEGHGATIVHTVPEPAELEEALSRVGYAMVELDPERHTVRLARPGMRIGFGALGKGYAANRAVGVLKDHGVTGGVVDAGGDLMAFGRQEDGELWTLGLADPTPGAAGRGAVFGRLTLSDQAVVTSGDYERYVEIDGVRYAHILDPRTGWPVRGVRSVTVVCPDGELADALATSVFVLGPRQGLALVDRLNGVEALVVDDAGKIHTSAHLHTLLSDGAPPADSLARNQPSHQGDS